MATGGFNFLQGYGLLLEPVDGIPAVKILSSLTQSGTSQHDVTINGVSLGPGYPKITPDQLLLITQGCQICPSGPIIF